MLASRHGNALGRAFWHGFFGGLAAPVMLFKRCDKPRIYQIELVDVRKISARDALAEDMMRVGADFRKAMNEYSQEHAARAA